MYYATDVMALAVSMAVSVSVFNPLACICGIGPACNNNNNNNNLICIAPEALEDRER